MNDPKRTHAAISDSIATAVTRVVDSGWYLSGVETSRFESAFAEYVGARHCVAVANGTDALELALRAFDVQPSDQVITVTNAGGYALASIAAIGATPVFVDVDPDTLTLDIAATVDAVGAATKIVVATHLFGFAVDVGELRRCLDAAGHHRVLILEDAAQAHGAVVGGTQVGALGDAATFSFYPTKNLGALGDAGAVTTSHDDVVDRLRSLHQYGWTQRYVSTMPGGRNSRIDEMQAAVLTVALPHLAGWNERRRSIVRRYTQSAPGDVEMVHAAAVDSAGFVGHLAVARTGDRSALVAHLSDHGVDTTVHYPVLDTDIPWLADIEHIARPTPQAIRACGEIVSLPCFPALTDAEVDHVANALAGFRPAPVPA